jgi:chromosomal replication initiator protein
MPSLESGSEKDLIELEDILKNASRQPGMAPRIVDLIYFSDLFTPEAMALAGKYSQKLNSINAASRLMAKDIISAVAEHFWMQGKDLLEKNNSPDITHPRHVAMYIVREMTGYSFPNIGRAFGGMHHTTVMYGIGKIRKSMESDLSFSSEIKKISRGILQAYLQKAP